MERLKKKLEKGGCPIVFVKWWDASTHPSTAPWVTLNDAIEGFGPYYCESVGFTVKLTKDGLTIVQSLSEASNGKGYDITNAFTIPIGCIIEINILS